MRFLDIIPLPDEQSFVVRDPLGFNEKTMVVPFELLLLMQLMDGERTVREIEVAITRQTGEIAAAGWLEEVVKMLDENYLLESNRFRSRCEELVREYRARPTRPATLAGKSYPEDPAKLREMLTGFFGASGIPVASNEKREPVRAIVAPHIDLRAGGECYADAYRPLIEANGAETFVVLGVAHFGGKGTFIGTRKGFETPLGTAACDTEFFDALSAKLPFDLCEEEIVHRTEHSIEFQVVFLQHLFGDRVKIVPILLGSFERYLLEGNLPEASQDASAFFSALQSVLAQYGSRAVVIVSVDLAHVGKRFGDETEMTPAFLKMVGGEDRDFLHAAEELNAEAIYRNMAKDNNARRVDGFGGIYTLLKVLPLQKGKLLRYEQSPDETDSCVTFASMSFW